MSSYEILLHVTLIVNILEKLTPMLGMVKIRKSVFPDVQVMSPRRYAKTPATPTQRTGKKLRHNGKSPTSSPND